MSPDDILMKCQDRGYFYFCHSFDSVPLPVETVSPFAGSIRLEICLTVLRVHHVSKLFKRSSKSLKDTNSPNSRKKESPTEPSYTPDAY